jgi:hypothetical protein
VGHRSLSTIHADPNVRKLTGKLTLRYQPSDFGYGARAVDWDRPRTDVAVCVQIVKRTEHIRAFSLTASLMSAIALFVEVLSR